MDLLQRLPKIKGRKEEVDAILTFVKGGTYNIVVLGLEGTLSENYQLMKGFGDIAYVTTMGKRLEPVTAQCVLFPKQLVCAEGDSTKLKELYEKERVGTGEVLEMTFAEITIRGVLIAISFSLKTKEIINFNLQMMGTAI